jgi:hypothetical protein
VNHYATPDFWHFYTRLPEEIQRTADKNFLLLKNNPRHPSIRLKQIGVFWSARGGIQYRALAKERTEGLVWVWIGHHSEYDAWRKTQ